MKVNFTKWNSANNCFNYEAQSQKYINNGNTKDYIFIKWLLDATENKREK